MNDHFTRQPSPSRALLSGVILFGLLGVIWLVRTAWFPGEPPAPAFPDQIELIGETMATTYSVKVVVTGSAGIDLQQLAAAVTEQLDLINSTMSRFDPDSDVSRLNHRAEAGPYQATPELVRMLTLAQDIGRRSGGAFDVTVGPLMALWGFDDHSGRTAPPTDDELAAARERCGSDKLTLDLQAATITKARPDVDVDLSGIAKGLAVDLVSETLTARGLTRHLVEIGGEVRGRGTNRSGEPWRVGVENPTAGVRELGQIVALTDLAMATSGDYRNFYELDGRRINHTMDPRTGRPVDHSVAEVTVIHPHCADADAWATALMVLGLDRGLAMAQGEGLAAQLITRDPDGTIERHPTAAFTAIVAAPEHPSPATATATATATAAAAAAATEEPSR